MTLPAVDRPDRTGGPTEPTPADPAKTPQLLSAIESLACRQGLTEAMSALHTAVCPGVLPAGPGGHVLLPRTITDSADRYTTADGPRARGSGAAEEFLPDLRPGELPAADDPSQPLPPAPVWTALRIRDAAPDPRFRALWQAGLLAARLGSADRSLAQAVERLRERTVQGTNLLTLPLVRSLIADAVASIAEARALMAGNGPEESEENGARRAHHALDRAGRSCLHLYGAAGLLANGPGLLIRRSELLADTYAPTAQEPHR